jgi:hypothetical protein
MLLFTLNKYTVLRLVGGGVMQFLDFVKKRRSELGYSCREFAPLVKMKPSDWNRIENGIIEIPGDAVALVFECLAVSAEEQEEITNAYLNYEVQPTKPLSEQELVEKLPMVFRKVDGTVMRKPELVRLAERLKTALA